MHGHGDKPFLCTYEHCERGVPGNGFPRHWNLRDHMKRVHNDSTNTRSNASTTSPPPMSRGKKRKSEASGSPKFERPCLKKPTIAEPAVSHSVKKSSLAERYQQTEMQLKEAVKQLSDPTSERTFALLQNANDCIKTMAHISQQMSNAVSSQRTPSPS